MTNPITEHTSFLGNCYTPATKTLRTINMPPKRRPPPNLYGPIGPNGELQFPPLKPWAEREKERLEAIEKAKGKNKLQKGVSHISLHGRTPY